MRAVEPDTPEHVFARAFADRVARWSRARGAPEAAVAAARVAAYAISQAVSSGQTCVALADVAGDGDAVALGESLCASRVVGSASDTNAPLIVDRAQRLYLARYFDYEMRLARAIALRAAEPMRSVSSAARDALAEQFDGNRAPGQKLAAALALLRSFAIVSGGPGTGKTTTIGKYLACVLADDPSTRIALAAPTGKAAARLQLAIAQYRQRLVPALGERLPQRVYTVHRLLGARADAREFHHDADHPLPFDVVVVDEASMLDLALAARLVEAVPGSARLLLVGDKDQLSAVEAGAVFAELSAQLAFSPACASALTALTDVPAPSGAVTQGAALTDGVMWLTDNFRFAPDSGVGRVATAVNAGDAAGARAAMHDDGGGVRWIDDAGVAPTSDTFAAIAAGYAAFVEAVRMAPDDRPRVFAAFDRFRVLCAERRGPRGARGINAAMTALLQDDGAMLALPAQPATRDGDTWFAGRPVMVLANDYLQGLFNGDVGVALPDTDGTLRVFFVAIDGGYRAIAPARLPPHETAFASTVHKAQGSEFDDVLLLLPARPSRVVTRELVYTALTRARRHATIVAGAAVLDAAVATPTRRDSGLIDRLHDALSGPPALPTS